MTVETSHLAETNKQISPGPLTPALRSALLSVLPAETIESYAVGAPIRDQRHAVLAWGLRQDTAARNDSLFKPAPELVRTVTEVLVSFNAITEKGI